MKTFKGRVVLGGNLTGEAVVSHQGFNTLATYFRGLTTGSSICNDQNNKDLYQKDLDGKIVCLPRTIGSTTGGMILQCAANVGIGPAAMLYADHVDSISSAGIILAEVWNHKKIVAIDQLGDEFLEAVQDGQKIEIKEDGSVIVC
jgi:predicted aconitase with swiveling domain